jgi:receptor expression-enhancing protein 1/2/3/4
MFDFFIRSLSSLASFVFPVLASYKALEHDDITLIRPWLVYWVVIAIQLTVEAYAGFILRALPLYELWRLCFMLWLVLPQFQGASQLYFDHVQPFLHSHEKQIDEFVTSGHQTAKAMGVEYLTRLTLFVQNALGSLVFGPTYKPVERHTVVPDLEPDGTASSSSSTGMSYADTIFSKFRIPESAYKPMPRYYSISSLVSSFASSSSARLSIPEGLSVSDKLDYLEKQRSKLMELVSSLDEHRKNIEQNIDNNNNNNNEQQSEGRSVATSLRGETSSEIDFDVVAKEEVDDDKKGPTNSPPRGWFGWR